MPPVSGGEVLEPAGAIALHGEAGDVLTTAAPLQWIRIAVFQHQLSVEGIHL